uniref:Calmodulin n=1 Tax=Lotharella oceanica TaxID=641309 RepID=A0A7S2TQY9_9EUKA|mmetsp:Transcript_25528/g.47613  ORF Transcript_25528/g.47613 Transcript_25528/m.47613 type:complete len:230 (+) Transcript_25528:143-832(+)|eukprot:CAMPEP_0170189238 /NCGR_PEP_ID=MMETSP0040_2-20121228/46313_1 /TAXON_ID=641309 /ORGANISM="Lotharella oceanica, Strain CCMP622" /LENGTH=229 /DNA_ID=CAMNT_0010436739 /DNA_START=134 /DNA_END=823 /DNA_ORIENTATION=+
MPKGGNKKDDKGADGEPKWKEDPIFLAIDPPIAPPVVETLEQMYFGVFEEKFIAETIHEIRKKADAAGETFKLPKNFSPQRPKKVPHLKLLWQHLGYTFTDIECEEQLALSDARGEKTLEFAGFLEIFAKIVNLKEETSSLVEAFRTLDPHGRGYVSMDEIKFAMTDLKDRVDKKKVGFPKMTSEELEALFAKAGVNQDNPNLKYEEFAKNMMTTITEEAKKPKKKKKK